MDYNELYHHGIKGMKWGVRRFQRKDGTRTAAGKKRERENLSAMSDQELRSKIDRMNLEKRYNSLSNGSRSSSGLDIAEKSAKAGSSASKIASSISKATNKGSSATDVVSKSFDTASKTVSAVKNIKSASKKKTDLSSMSDKELRERVNRMDLEQQYSDLKKETVSKGRVNASQVLDTAGSILAVGASATTLALSIYKMTKKK